MDFLFAYILTLAIETAMLYFLLNGRYSAALIVRNSVIASSLTLPFVWFFFFTLPLPYNVQTAISEAFAVVVEAGIYALLFKGLTTKDAFLSSVACNWASFIIGLAIS